MRAVDPARPLFVSRLDAGEDLYFKRPLGDREPLDTQVLVASDGAVEVAWPWAYLCGLPVRRLDLDALPADLAELAGRTVVIVDDGLLSPGALAGLTRLAATASPRQLRVVAPALRTVARRALRGMGLDPALTLRPSTQADAAQRLYPQRPAAPAVARVLLSEVQGARNQPSWGPDPLSLVAK